MKNKQIMDRLEEYFLTQDPKIVARMCASHLVDLNRYYRLEELPYDEAVCLMQRMEMNMEQLYKFIKDGADGDIKIQLRNSE